MYTDRRTFITAVLGTAFLAGCANDPDLASPVGGSTAPTTGPPSTVPATTLATATTIAPTTVASVAPVASLPSSASWWLDGNFAPVGGDLEATNLSVTGRLPAALSGTWVRNGSNPAGESAHWFLGNAMVHGLRLRDGQAEWYRRRSNPDVVPPRPGERWHPWWCRQLLEREQRVPRRPVVVAR